MPVKFKTIPAHGAANSDPLGVLQSKVRAALNLPEDASIAVGMTMTNIRFHGLDVSLPVGMAYLKNGKPMDLVVERITTLFGPLMNVSSPDKFTAALEDMNPVGVAAGKDPVAEPYDDMSDEEWVHAVSAKLFPGVIHLHQADAMHQPVLGTASGSVYKTCFIGPELKVAARIKGNSVSFRVTTNTNVAPTGDVKAIFDRLGVVNGHADRLTCHASMSGPYTTQTAGEYRALFGAFYAALRPWLTSGFPAIGKLAEGVK